MYHMCTSKLATSRTLTDSKCPHDKSSGFKRLNSNFSNTGSWIDIWICCLLSIPGICCCWWQVSVIATHYYKRTWFVAQIEHCTRGWYEGWLWELWLWENSRQNANKAVGNQGVGELGIGQHESLSHGFVENMFWIWYIYIYYINFVYIYICVCIY